MTAGEYRAILAALELTQTGAARLLGINPRTSRRWALGEQDITETAARFLRLLVAAKITPARAARLLQIETHSGGASPSAPARS